MDDELTEANKKYLAEFQERHRKEIASWGPKCKRCGADEFRIKSFCSVYCKDMYYEEQENEELRKKNLELQKALADMFLLIEEHGDRTIIAHATRISKAHIALNNNAVEGI